MKSTRPGCRVAAMAALVLALVPGTASAARPERVIVQFKSTAGPGDRARALAGAPVMGAVYGTTQQVVQPLGDPEALVAALRRSHLVRFAEVDHVMRAATLPNDPQISAQYGLARIDAYGGWYPLGLAKTFPSSGGVKIGIVDTGIRATHRDLAGHLADCATVSQGLLGIGAGVLSGGSCTDGNGHGTHVAGIAVATANNGVGIAGVAFNSSLAVCKGLANNGSGSTDGVATCIRWLKDKGARVISLSLTGPGSTTLQQAVRYAWAGGAGAIIVAAAGNDGNATLNYPAAYAEVVSVAATDATDAHANFSNANADVEVAAPGVDVLSTWSSSDTAYRLLSGTSMATPHAAGVAALIRDRFPTADAATVRARLDAAVTDLGVRGRDPLFGFGRVEAYRAVTGR